MKYHIIMYRLNLLTFYIKRGNYNFQNTPSNIKERTINRMITYYENNNKKLLKI